MSQPQSARSETILTPANPAWRIAWPFFHKPREKGFGGKILDKPKFDATLIAPKLDPDPMKCANYQLLATLCMEAANKMWGQWPQGGIWPIKDGDEPPKPSAPTAPGQNPVPPPDRSWCKGCWFMNISNGFDTGPKVAILQNGQAVEIAAQSMNGRTFYKSGDYGVVSLNAWTYNNAGKYGVSFGFDGVLFVAEGETIGGGPRSVDQMFGAIAGTIHPNSPSSGAPQPPPYGVAPQPGMPSTAPSAMPPAQQMTGAQYAAPGHAASAAPPPPMAPGVPAGLPPFPQR